MTADNFATAEGGDEISFIARLKGWDERVDFGRILDCYEKIANRQGSIATEAVIAEKPPINLLPPEHNHLGKGSSDQIQSLSELRGISIDALNDATDQGFLVFGRQFGFEVFGIKDQTGLIVEVRRLDGKPFPAMGDLAERKSHTLKGSKKCWPVGLVEAESKSTIMLVEGLPDFLAAFDFIRREGKRGVVAPVAMLAASAVIDNNAVERFQRKRLRMFPHNDAAGFDAAKRWTRQLNKVTEEIDYFSFQRFANVKDLADLNRCSQAINEEVLP